MPDSKWAADWRRIVAARDAEYFPPVGMPRICSRIRLLYLPGAIWAKSGCVALNKTTMLAVILARLRFNTTRSQIIAIGFEAIGRPKKLQVPSIKLQRNIKLQTSNGASGIELLELGIWSLELGAWCFGRSRHAPFGFPTTLC